MSVPMRVDSDMLDLGVEAANYSAVGKPAVPPDLAQGPVAERTTIGLSHEVLGALKVVSTQIYDSFVRPSLKAATPAAYADVIKDVLPRYLEAYRAFRFIMNAGSLDRACTNAWAERTRGNALAAVRERIEDVAGANASLEVDFAEKTVARSARLVERFVSLAPPESKKAEDCMAALSYEVNCGVFSFEMCSLVVVTHERPHLAPGIVHSIFEFLRRGALGAHQSAKMGLRLRATTESPSQIDFSSMRGGVDDEDTALVMSSERDASSDLRSAEE